MEKMNPEQFNKPENKTELPPEIEERIEDITKAIQEIDQQLKETPDRIDIKKVVIENLTPVLGDFADSDDLFEMWLDLVQNQRS